MKTNKNKCTTFVILFQVVEQCWVNATKVIDYLKVYGDISLLEILPSRPHLMFRQRPINICKLTKRWQQIDCHRCHHSEEQRVPSPHAKYKNEEEKMSVNTRNDSRKDRPCCAYICTSSIATSLNVFFCWHLNNASSRTCVEASC